jgi:ferredoxin-NADP reductase
MTRASRRIGHSDLLRVVAVGRSSDELPYADELTRSGATIMYTRAASQTRQPGPPTAEELRPLLTGREIAFVCGSSRFAEFAEALLIGCGFSPQAIRVEQFGATH